MRTLLKLFMSLIVCILSRDAGGKPIEMSDTNMDILTRTLIGLDKDKTSALSAVLELLAAIDLPSLCLSLSPTAPNITHVEDLIVRAANRYDTVRTAEKTDSPSAELKPEKLNLVDFTNGKEDFTNGKEDFTNIKEDFANGKEDFADGKEDITSGKADFTKRKENFINTKDDFTNGEENFIHRKVDFTDRKADSVNGNADFSNRKVDFTERKADSMDGKSDFSLGNADSVDTKSFSGADDNVPKTPPVLSDSYNFLDSLFPLPQAFPDYNLPLSPEYPGYMPPVFPNNDDIYDVSSNMINDVAAVGGYYPSGYPDGLRMAGEGISRDNSALFLPEDLKMLTSLTAEDIENLSQVLLHGSQPLKPESSLAADSRLRLEASDDDRQLSEESGDRTITDGGDLGTETTPSPSARNHTTDSAVSSMSANHTSQQSSIISGAGGVISFLSDSLNVTESTALESQNGSSTSRRVVFTTSSTVSVSTGQNKTTNSHEQSPHKPTNRTASNPTHLTDGTGNLNDSGIKVVPALFQSLNESLQADNSTTGLGDRDVTIRPVSNVSDTGPASDSSSGTVASFSTSQPQPGSEPSLPELVPASQGEKMQTPNSSVSSDVSSSQTAAMGIANSSVSSDVSSSQTAAMGIANSSVSSDVSSSQTAAMGIANNSVLGNILSAAAAMETITSTNTSSALPAWLLTDNDEHTQLVNTSAARNSLSQTVAVETSNDSSTRNNLSGTVAKETSNSSAAKNSLSETTTMEISNSSAAKNSLSETVTMEMSNSSAARNIVSQTVMMQTKISAPSSVHSPVNNLTDFRSLAAQQEGGEKTRAGMYGSDTITATDLASASTTVTAINTTSSPTNTSVSEVEDVSLRNTTMLPSPSNATSPNLEITDLDKQNTVIVNDTDVPVPGHDTQRVKILAMGEKAGELSHTSLKTNEANVTQRVVPALAERNSSNISIIRTEDNSSTNNSQQTQQAAASSGNLNTNTSSQLTKQASPLAAQTHVTTEERKAASTANKPSSEELTSTMTETVESDMEQNSSAPKVNSAAISDRQGRQRETEHSVINTDSRTVTTISSISFHPDLPVTKPAPEASSHKPSQDSNTVTRQIQTAESEDRVRDTPDLTNRIPDSYHHLERQEWKPVFSSLEKNQEDLKAPDTKDRDLTGQQSWSPWTDRQRDPHPQPVNSVAAATPADYGLLQNWFQPIPVYDTDSAGPETGYLSVRDSWRTEERVETDPFPARLLYSSPLTGDVDRLISQRGIRSQPYSAFGQSFARRQASPFRPFISRPNLGTLWANGVDYGKQNQYDSFYNVQKPVITASSSSVSTNPLPSSSHPHHNSPDFKTTVKSRGDNDTSAGSDVTDDVTDDVRTDSFKSKEEALNSVREVGRDSWREASPEASFKAKEEAIERLRLNSKDNWSETDLYGRLQPRYEGYACPGLFGFFGDVMDCRSFFICSWGVPYRFACPSGTLWNPTRSVCDWSRDVTCSN